MQWENIYIIFIQKEMKWSQKGGMVAKQAPLPLRTVYYNVYF